VGIVKHRVLRGLWRRLVGVGIIRPGLSGAGPYTILEAVPTQQAEEVERCLVESLAG
jgi:hypothetical protein